MLRTNICIGVGSCHYRGVVLWSAFGPSPDGQVSGSRIGMAAVPKQIFGGTVSDPSPVVRLASGERPVLADAAVHSASSGVEANGTA